MLIKLQNNKKAGRNTPADGIKTEKNALSAGIPLKGRVFCEKRVKTKEGQQPDDGGTKYKQIESVYTSKYAFTVLPFQDTSANNHMYPFMSAKLSALERLNVPTGTNRNHLY